MIRYTMLIVTLLLTLSLFWLPFTSMAAGSLFLSWVLIGIFFALDQIRRIDKRSYDHRITLTEYVIRKLGIDLTLILHTIFLVTMGVLVATTYSNTLNVWVMTLVYSITIPGTIWAVALYRKVTQLRIPLLHKWAGKPLPKDVFDAALASPTVQYHSSDSRVWNHHESLEPFLNLITITPCIKDSGYDIRIYSLNEWLRYVSDDNILFLPYGLETSLDLRVRNKFRPTGHPVDTTVFRLQYRKKRAVNDECDSDCSLLDTKILGPRIIEIADWISKADYDHRHPLRATKRRKDTTERWLKRCKERVGPNYRTTGCSC